MLEAVQVQMLEDESPAALWSGTLPVLLSECQSFGGGSPRARGSFRFEGWSRTLDICVPAFPKCQEGDASTVWRFSAVSRMIDLSVST